jgi:hypothetical protein
MVARVPTVKHRTVERIIRELNTLESSLGTKLNRSRDLDINDVIRYANLYQVLEFYHRVQPYTEYAEKAVQHE